MAARYKCLFILLLPLFLAACSTSESTEKIQITVSAASSLADSLFELKEELEGEMPQVEILYNFGGSGSLRRQIEYGAPIDLFLSASKKDYEQLLDAGIIKTGSLLVHNELVWIIRTDNVGHASPPQGRIAIGTPKAVPAGTYAKEALENMGLWESLHDQVVYAKDARHVVTLVQQGTIDAGIVYRSDAQQRKGLTMIPIDSRLYSEIEYFIGIVAGENDMKKQRAVEEVYRFLLSEEAMNVYKNHGFQM